MAVVAGVLVGGGVERGERNGVQTGIVAMALLLFLHASCERTQDK